MWQNQLWEELRGEDAVDRYVKSGEWITYVTQTLLPELRKERRRAVIEVLSREDWDALRLAETVGSRRTTIQRLAEEGRALARDEARYEQEAA